MNQREAQNQPADTAASALVELVSRDGFILYSRDIAHRLGYKAALLLGHALYWSRYLARNEPGRGGWFFMTAAQWQQATGLSKHEQAAARETLKDAGLLAEKLSRHANQLNYHVNLAALATLIGIDLAGSRSEPGRWRALETWLHQSVAFYRPLVDACGSVSAALYLSYLLRLQRGAVAVDGSVLVRQADVRRALCLGVKAQRNARARLAERGLVSESYGQVAIQFAALDKALRRSEGKLPNERQEPRHYALLGVARTGDQPASTPAQRALNLQHRSRAKVAPKAPQQVDFETLQLSTDSVDNSVNVRGVVKKGQVVDTSELALFEPSTCPFSTTNLPFFNHPISIGINKTTTTTRARKRSAPQPGAKAPAIRRRRMEEFSRPALVAVDGQTVEQEEPGAPADAPEPESCALHLPDKLDKSWHDAVRQTLQAAPAGRRQVLLDELAGQLTVKEIKNPAGYLHALIRKDAEGTLVLAMADSVSRTRQQRQRHEERLRKVMNGEADQPRPAARPPVAAVAQSDTAKQALEQLRGLREKFRAGGAR